MTDFIAQCLTDAREWQARGRPLPTVEPHICAALLVLSTQNRMLARNFAEQHCGLGAGSKGLRVVIGAGLIAAPEQVFTLFDSMADATDTLPTINQSA